MKNDLQNLQNLVDRAKRHGIDVYLYVNEPRAMPHEFFRKRTGNGRSEGERVHGDVYQRPARCASGSAIRWHTSLRKSVAWVAFLRSPPRKT